MYARCTISQGEAAAADQVEKIMRDQVIPFGRELEGFKGVLAFVDRESGKGLTFTLWESEAARSASVEAANKVRADVLEELDETLVAVENYELLVDERFG